MNPMAGAAFLYLFKTTIFKISRAVSLTTYPFSILASVLIPSFVRFIDRSKFSNDTQVAGSMTSILTSHLATNPDQPLDSYDVRTIINEYHGSNFDFTPSANNTGYFYLENSNRIIAAKYDDIESIIDGEELKLDTVLLSNMDLDFDDIVLPEQLFGATKHLLTTDGSPVAQTVHFISSMANQGTSIQTAYDTVHDGITNRQDNAFVRFLGLGLDDDIKNKLLDLLDTFNPASTVFVNNIDWVTTASDGSDINRIVFTPGISNIPTCDLELTDEISDLNVELPATVRTIMSHAFKQDIFTSLDVSIRQGIPVQVHNDAFDDSINVDLGNAVYGNIDLIDYSDEVSFDVAGGQFNYDFSNLSIKAMVTGYQFEYENDILTVIIYTLDGIVGYASNAYTIYYYLEEGDLYPYYYLTSANTTFFEPPMVMTKTNYDFDGWYVKDAGQDFLIETGDSITSFESHSIHAYASWKDK